MTEVQLVPGYYVATRRISRIDMRIERILRRDRRGLPITGGSAAKSCAARCARSAEAVLALVAERYDKAHSRPWRCHFAKGTAAWLDAQKYRGVDELRRISQYSGPTTSTIRTDSSDNPFDWLRARAMWR